MSTTTEYSVEKELTEAVDAIVNDKQFTELSLLPMAKVKACFRIRMGEDGETVPSKGPAAVLRKVSPVDKVFMRDPSAYILVVDYHAWKNIGAKQTSMLHEALQAANVENKDGELKIGAPHKPDITAYSKNIRHFGAWNNMLLDLRETLRTSKPRLPFMAADVPPAQDAPVEAAEEPAGETELPPPLPARGKRHAKSVQKKDEEPEPVE